MCVSVNNIGVSLNMISVSVNAKCVLANTISVIVKTNGFSVNTIGQVSVNAIGLSMNNLRSLYEKEIELIFPIHNYNLINLPQYILS